MGLENEGIMPSFFKEACMVEPFIGPPLSEGKQLPLLGGKRQSDLLRRWLFTNSIPFKG